MRWRISRLNWSYGLGELLIIVVGVLIALAADQWNSQRLEQIEEIEIVERLIADLNTDFANLAAGQDIASAKRIRLARLLSNLDTPADRPTDLDGFFHDIVLSAAYGWDQANPRRTTFNELLSSGKLSLIRSSAIRTSMIEYYEAGRVRAMRIDERETGYSALSYQLVPRSTEYEVANDISAPQVERIFAKLLEPVSRDLLVAESNFAGFVSAQFVEWEAACESLLRDLKSYLASIR